MGVILQRRLRTTRAFPPGEEAMLALTIAGGDLGSVVERVLRDHGLTRHRYNILRILRGAGSTGVSCGDLAERLRVAHPEVTRLLDPMVDAGWVARQRAAHDRRVVLQLITRSGLALLRRLDPPLSRVHETLRRALGPKVLARLVADCERIIDAVERGRIHANQPSTAGAEA